MKNPPAMAGFLFWYDGRMSWATTRQLLFVLGVLVVLAVLGVVTYVSFFYTPASCSDQKQNQNETGVDCGGACARLCVAPALSTLWPPRAVKVAPGVYHVVTLVKNPDTTASGKFPYSVSLYDTENVLVAVRDGTFSIGPGEVAPLFEANIITGERIPSRAFVDIERGEFYTASRETPAVRVDGFQVDSGQARVTATIENTSLSPFKRVTVTALLYDENDTLMQASQTVLEDLRGGERRVASFTWQEPFSVEPSRVDIIPRVGD